MKNLPNCHIAPNATISDDARIFPPPQGVRIKIGAHTRVFEFVVIRTVGGKGDISIGEYCHINPHCLIYSGSNVTIGNNVLIAPGTAIVPANHSFASRLVPIREQGFAPSKGGVLIEDDVWIGANCVVLDGSIIRRGAVIAAGSVVRGEIPPYTVWGGVPARFIKDRP